MDLFVANDEYIVQLNTAKLLVRPGAPGRDVARTLRDH